MLSKNLSGSQFGWTVDGATIMSEEFYKDKRLSQTIVLRVSNLNYFWVFFLEAQVLTWDTRLNSVICRSKFFVP